MGQPEAWVRVLAVRTFGEDTVRDFPWGNRGVQVLTEDGTGFAALAWAGAGRGELDTARTAAGLPPEDESCYLSLIAVEESHRGQGIGGRLLDAILAEANGRGVPVEAVAWDQSHSPPHGLFCSRGFTALAPVPGLWTEYDCPVCQGPPCRCTWTLFRREPS